MGHTCVTFDSQTDRLSDHSMLFGDNRGEYFSHSWYIPILAELWRSKSRPLGLHVCNNQETGLLSLSYITLKNDAKRTGDQCGIVLLMALTSIEPHRSQVWDPRFPATLMKSKPCTQKKTSLENQQARSWPSIWLLCTNLLVQSCS